MHLSYTVFIRLLADPLGLGAPFARPCRAVGQLQPAFNWTVESYNADLAVPSQSNILWILASELGC